VSISVCAAQGIKKQMQDALTALDKGLLTKDEEKRIIRIGDHVHKSAKGFL